ncbi:MAG: glucose-1-phosphate thymidylyltransferase, partial [Candidatus Hydrothermarchaeaceae archaeon]
MKGLILAGGSGMRLRPLTHTGPKQLIPIANKPALFYGVEDLREAGIKEIGVILGLNMPEMIEEALGNGSAFDTNITYVPQGEPKGLAHAVLVSKEYLGDESFVMYLGDNLLKAGVKEFVNNFEGSKFDARILLTKVKNPQQFGVAELDGSGKVIRLEEKPKKPKSDLALVGVYLFKSSIFKAVSQIKPSWRNELEITDAIQWLIDNGYNVDSHIVEGWWKDTGKPKDLLDANRLVLDGLEPSNHGKIEENVQIHGRVSIGEG